MFQSFFESLGTGVIDRIFNAVILLVIGILAIRLAMKLLRQGLEKTKLEKAAHSLILSLAKAVLYILLGLNVADFITARYQRGGYHVIGIAPAKPKRVAEIDLCQLWEQSAPPADVAGEADK